MNPAPTPAETATPATAPAIVSTRLDTRGIPLGALLNRVLIGAEGLPETEKRPTTGTCAFNACI